MKVIRETTVAGKTISVTYKAAGGYRSGKKKGSCSITSDAVKKNNARLAAKKLTFLINANFGKNDWHTTLTYKEEVTTFEARKICSNFIKTLSRAMKKNNQELKYVLVTEYKNQRIHHHFLTNAPRELVNEKWKKGLCLFRPLDEGPDYSKLAEYLIKETEKTFREEDSAYKTRYTHSRNLYIPETKIEEVSEKHLYEDPKAWKGYYIDQDSLKRFEHPITGIPHVEFVMYSIDEKPRIKKYYKGRTKKHEVNYSRYINYIEQQESLFDIL